MGSGGDSSHSPFTFLINQKPGSCAEKGDFEEENVDFKSMQTRWNGSYRDSSNKNDLQR